MVEPNPNTEPGFTLPAPKAEQGQAAPENQPHQAPERANPAEKSGELPQSGGQPTPTTPPPLPPSPIAGQQTGSQPPAQTDNGSPASADDADLIEKEWVDKAKAIVEHTKNDPHQQTKAVNRLKADYIKKRYNRDIKTGEE